MLKLKEEKGAVLLSVKVSPGAARTKILGVLDGRLKVAVAAAPEKGKANEELVSFLADQLGVRRRAVSIASGPASPKKTIRIEGVSAEAVSAAFQPSLP